MKKHLSVEEIATYVDGTATRKVRARVERHASDCLECGDEILAASRDTRSAPGPSRLRIPVWISAGAVAAATGAFLLFGVGAFGDRDPAPRLRDGFDGVRVRVLQPADGASVATPAPVFVWRPVADEAFYTFSITNDVGDVLWQGETTDTTQSLAGHLTLRGGERYFWRVEALLPDGRTADTGAHEIEVTP